MPYPLLPTKLYMPPGRRDGVLRPRLTARLLEAVQRPRTLALLSCPAGFGKTTLLAEFVQALARPVAWLSLDEADNDPVRFWSYVIAACQAVQKGIGDAALGMLQMPQPLPDEGIPALLIRELDGMDRELVLVLDDYQAIRTKSIQAGMRFLVEHQPERLHLLVSTRVDPPWPLARLRARNQLIELRAADLRFTTEEVRAFLEGTMGLRLSAEDSLALEARTEGWIASLQLAALSMQGRSNVDAFIKAFTGSNAYVAEYLVEEVLQRQPDAVQDFLLMTSVLEQLHPALCDAVTGSADGAAMLRQLAHANLFLVPLDEQGQWFRYHRLFADLLQARLQQSVGAEAVAQLRQRAAQWYEQAGMTHEAIEQALAARDYADALRLVGKAALPMILQAYVRTVDRWLQSIPPELVAESPRANMALAWMYLLRVMTSEAAPYMDRLERLFAAIPANGGDPSLMGEWLALRSKLLTMQGKPAEARDLAMQALEILPAQDAPVRTMLYVNLELAHQQMLEYEQAAEIFRLIVREARAAGNFFIETLGLSGRGQMLLQQGKLHAAFEAASEGLERLKATGGTTPFSATLYGEMGSIHYDWHELEAARAYFQQSIRASGLSGFSDPEIFHHVVLSRIAQMEGDWEAAGREVDKAEELAHAFAPAMVREQLVSQQIRVELACGRVDAAKRQLEREGFRLGAEIEFPGLQPGAIITHPAGLLHNSALRVLLHEAGSSPRRLRKGIELADNVLAGELQCQHIGIALETLLLRAQLQAALGDEGAAQEDITTALELARPEGFISVFIEEGQPVAEALKTLLSSGQTDAGLSGQVRDILAAFPGPLAEAEQPLQRMQIADDELPVQALSRREMEVLQLIAAGNSNQAIAEKLVITLSAVKKHTGNIYRKLNVDSRTQAAARARQLGLLTAAD